MNLSTKYLGIDLKNPLVPSSSPLMHSVENIKAMEDSGAAAVVLHSLFEEQITQEALKIHYHTTQGTDSFAEALSYFPEPAAYKFAGDEYLEHIQKVRKAVKIPIIGSLNGVTSGGWIEYAKKMQDAGADAVELNIYYVATDTEINGAKLEMAYLDVLKAVKASVKIPVALKLSPYFTSFPSMAKSFAIAGADGLVMFNRFYQPDIDVENLTVKTGISLSHANTTRQSLRWISALYGKLDVSMAATGGVHTSEDVIKVVMAGADAAYLCSALLKNGIDYLGDVLKGVEKWMSEHDYESLEQMKGSMSMKSVAEPAAYERALYIKDLQSYRV